MRKAEMKRVTKETQIEMKLDLDGNGNYKIETPVKFLNHMLEILAKQGMFDLEIKAKGDDYADDHHIAEDIAIVLGKAFGEALSKREGIRRYGSAIIPLEEALATAAIDLANRSCFVSNLDRVFTREKVGDLSTEMLYDFFKAFSDNCRATINLQVNSGRNNHHIAEAAFKAFARALRQACEIDEKLKNEVASTKGCL